MSYTGPSNLIELPTVKGWDPRTGWTLTRRWRGTPVAVASKLTELKTAGIKFQYEPSDDGSWDEIAGTYGSEDTQPPEEPLSEQWALVGNELEKSIWELDKVKDVMETITPTAARARVRGLIDAIARGERTVVEDGVESPLNVSYIFADDIFDGNQDVEPLLAFFDELVGVMTKGVEAFSISQFILRQVRLIAANSTIKPSLTNVGKVLTTATLTSSEGVPGTIRFDLPEGVWLKRTPTVEQVAADKWQITQEWWHADKYEKFIYGDAL